MAASDLSWTTNYSEYAEKRYCCIGAELLSIEPWNTGTDGFVGCEDMPRKSIDNEFSDYPIQQKRGNYALFLSSGENGLGNARYWVEGLVPCRFLGQRLKPSESLLEVISAIFKVHLSLFLWLIFFITYLKLPIFSKNNNTTQ